MVTKNSCNEPTASVGKVLQGQGVGTASDFSTATYPSVATGTGTILRADGTNWVPTTATYPNTAGANGNVLTSDGTNWNSSAPAGGGIFNGYLKTGSSSVVSSDTYYLSPLSPFFTIIDAARITVRFYATVNFTLNKVYASFIVGGTLGSAENCTLFIRVNNAANTNVSTTVQLTAATVNVTNNAVGLALNAGDYFSFGFTCPVWTTTPGNVSAGITFSN